MSSKPIIKIENLGKRYQIVASQMSHSHSIREGFTRWVKKMPHKGSVKEELWALKNLNLSIYPGQILGVIGVNGSGKSTLLKILARVTWPTTGKVTIQGRVSALLEVGTGFHLELSGRENIFLSGAILGMKKSEVIEYFDEIVAFSEVGKFLDTPVKRYSSGMFLRLAFSIISHLRSDVLILDEILAVGDVQFQLKCIKRIEALMKEGKTVIFVSHQFAKVEQLCNQTLWLKNGEVAGHGPTGEILENYYGYYNIQYQKPNSTSSSLPNPQLSSL